MCLTVKEVKEILDGMRDDALVLVDKELEGDAAHELTAYEYPSGDKKDWNFVILTWEKQGGYKIDWQLLKETVPKLILTNQKSQRQFLKL